MATIEMSPAFYSGLPTRMLNPYVASSDTIYLKQLLNQKAFFCIMRGTVPADANSILVSRMSDTLVWWEVGTISGGSTNLFPITVGQTTILNAHYKAAILSGTATWFQWCHRSFDPPSTANNVNLAVNYSHIIMGTVGTPGSGADLIIPDLNIVSGQLYRFSNLAITFPSSWTY